MNVLLADVESNFKIVKDTDDVVLHRHHRGFHLLDRGTLCATSFDKFLSCENEIVVLGDSLVSVVIIKPSVERDHVIRAVMLCYIVPYVIGHRKPGLNGEQFGVIDSRLAEVT